jgi:tubulin gamma
VVTSILQSPSGSIFSPDNVYLYSEGCGAGNNWAAGYSSALQLEDMLMDMMDRETERCDSLEGFILSHSVAGGTGSGLGSHLLQSLGSRYKGKLLTTFSVFPNSEEVSDVVVQPYNTILALNCLCEFADATVVIDNAALNRIATEKLRVSNPTFAQTNQLVWTLLPLMACCKVSSVMAAMTSTIRFPSYTHNDMRSIVSSVVPFNDLHFLVASYTPFTSDTVDKVFVKLTNHVKIFENSRKSDVFDILRRLLLQKNAMISAPSSKPHSNIAILNILRGNIDPTELHKGLARIKDRRMVNFVPWCPVAYQTAISKAALASNQIQGLCLTNSTSVAAVFKRNVDQYDRLRKRNAFLDQYRKFDIFSSNFDAFDHARSVVGSLIAEYEKAESIAFLE